MVIGISAVIGKIVLGSLSDKIRRIKIMLLCALLIAVGCLGMSYEHGVTLTAFAVIFGVGYGTVWSMYAASSSDYFPKEYSGSIVGLWTLYLGIGSTLSPVIAGWIADTTGTLAWSFVLAAAGAALSFLLLIPLWKVTSGDLRRN
jgi:OFA family oxalate/formate antiporter-like MFS transporter